MSARDIIRHSLWICWKDLLEFSRSKLRLIMLVLMPLFMMVMVGFIFPSGDSMISNQPIAIANMDNGPMGNSFIMQLEAVNNKTDMMELSLAKDFEEIKDEIQNSTISGGIIIPENFSSNIFNGEQGYISIVIDQSNPQMSVMIQTALSNVIEGMGEYMAKSNLNSTYHVSDAQATSMIKPYNVQIRSVPEEKTNYFQFVAPGIIAMVVMMALMTGLPHAISYEKDIGTLDGMLAAPIH